MPRKIAYPCKETPMSLNPEELHVESFETVEPAAALYPIIAPTTDPTAQTRCFVCPPFSANCW
jgi:hypothetical protein